MSQRDDIRECRDWTDPAAAANRDIVDSGKLLRKIRRITQGVRFRPGSFYWSSDFALKKVAHIDWFNDWFWVWATDAPKKNATDETNEESVYNPEEQIIGSLFDHEQAWSLAEVVAVWESGPVSWLEGGRENQLGNWSWFSICYYFYQAILLPWS